MDLKIRLSGWLSQPLKNYLEELLWRIIRGFSNFKSKLQFKK